MIEKEIEELIEREIKNFTYVNKIDVKCFSDHRINPRLIKLCMDTQGKEWKECYLVTDHNGVNDSPYRVAFDPEFEKFVREVTLENDVPLYLGYYPDLETLVDEFS